MKNLFLKPQVLLIALITFSCSSGPDPINYGSDSCTFCQMTIVDKQHAAQLVTEKGKNYKYDAIECMINDLNKWERPPVALHLVADYANPGTLTDALKASYMICEEIPSPMGEFLSAFADESERNEVYGVSGGDTMDWEQLLGSFQGRHTHSMNTK